MSPTQSVAEMRTEIGLSSGQAARTREHLQRIAHAVFQAAAVFVLAVVQQGVMKDDIR
jgi:hypothetical protein